MPELPEVETVRRDLMAHLLNKKIKSVTVLNLKTVGGQTEDFARNLQGTFFIDILRRGKLLIFKLKRSDLFLLTHLKMTGQLIYLDGVKVFAGGHSVAADSYFKAVGGALPNKYTRVIIEFADKSRLFFNDLRKFGYMKIVNQKELDEFIEKNYGPEPLDKDFVLAEFVAKLRKRSRNIKAVLLDQKIVTGLGNIYVDEVLFAAGVRPMRIASSLTKTETTSVYKEIKRILTLAIKHRGTTFSNYVDSKGQPGNFSQKLKVYGRGKETCYVCSTAIIKTKIAGRGTHYCPHCQK